MNILQRAGNSLGYNHTEEAKMNVPKSEEHKAKMSAANGVAIFVYDINGT
jgi:hypothetical protein